MRIFVNYKYTDSANMERDEQAEDRFRCTGSCNSFRESRTRRPCHLH